MRFGRFVLGLSSILILAEPVTAQTPDPRATDAVAFFASFCVSTGGSRDRALAVLGDGNALVNRLPDDVVQQAQGGREGEVGWMVRSPRDAQFMLEYNTLGLCGVRLKEADEDAVINAFESVMKRIVAGTGAELAASKPEKKVISGIDTTYRTYTFPFGGQNAHLALTTAKKPVGSVQHFMTFGVVK